MSAKATKKTVKKNVVLTVAQLDALDMLTALMNHNQVDEALTLRIAKIHNSLKRKFEHDTTKGDRDAAKAERLDKRKAMLAAKILKAQADLDKLG